MAFRPDQGRLRMTVSHCSAQAKALYWTLVKAAGGGRSSSVEGHNQRHFKRSTTPVGAVNTATAGVLFSDL